MTFAPPCRLIRFDQLAVETLMLAFHVIQPHNRKPIVPRTERSATRGIPGMANQLSFGEEWFGAVGPCFGARWKKRAVPGKQRSRSGCLILESAA
jgi:hypothetical protein